MAKNMAERKRLGFLIALLVFLALFLLLPQKLNPLANSAESAKDDTLKGKTSPKIF